VVDVLQRQVQLVLVLLQVADVLRAAVGQHAQERDAFGLEERQHPVIEGVGGGQRVLAVVELADGDPRVSVDEGLLVDTPDALERADVEGILRAQIARVFCLDLPVGRPKRGLKRTSAFPV
jgi:hypothetical protein